MSVGMIERDRVNIRASETKEVLDAYEAEARRRGFRDGEKAEIDRVRKERGWM
ncbi:hypothetical protein [Paenirhodobacter populi]|uniref:hypothetical protein n=1 Tax=Paenirhodobacter populi TaxID=2306993 RepID=UPI0013E3322F|nr:hypothetical protein [Sinirhodobacter populi]